MRFVCRLGPHTNRVLSGQQFIARGQKNGRQQKPGDQTTVDRLPTDDGYPATDGHAGRALDKALLVLKWRSQELNVKLSTVAQKLVVELPDLLNAKPGMRAPIDHYLLTLTPAKTSDDR